MWLRPRKSSISSTAESQKPAEITALAEQLESLKKNEENDDDTSSVEASASDHDSDEEDLKEESTSSATSVEQSATRPRRRSVASLTRAAGRDLAARINQLTTTTSNVVISDKPLAANQRKPSPKLIESLEKMVPQIAQLRMAFKTVTAIAEVTFALVLDGAELPEDDIAPKKLASFHAWVGQHSNKILTEFSLEQDFSPWTERICDLYALKDEVLNEYNIDYKNPYTMASLPLVKLQYFYRELTLLQVFGEKFQKWVKDINQQEYAFLADSKLERFWHVVEVFTKAIKQLCATTAIFNIILLSMEKSLKKTRAFQQSLSPAIYFSEMQVLEEKKPQFSLEQLEDSVITFKEEIHAQQLVIDNESSTEREKITAREKKEELEQIIENVSHEIERMRQKESAKISAEKARLQQEKMLARKVSAWNEPYSQAVALLFEFYQEGQLKELLTPKKVQGVFLEINVDQLQMWVNRYPSEVQILLKKYLLECLRTKSGNTSSPHPLAVRNLELVNITFDVSEIQLVFKDNNNSLLYDVVVNSEKRKSSINPPVQQMSGWFTRRRPSKATIENSKLSSIDSVSEQQDEEFFLQGISQVDQASNMGKLFLRLRQQESFFRYKMVSNEFAQDDLSRGNLFLELYDIRKKLLKKMSSFSEVQVLRVEAMLSIFDNMRRHLDRLPEWITQYFSAIDDKTRKACVTNMPDAQKIKIAFWLAIEFFRNIFMALSAHEAMALAATMNTSNRRASVALSKKALKLPEGLKAISIIFKDVASDFQLPYEENSKAIFYCAAYFLEANAEFLLKNTIFKTQNLVSPPEEVVSSAAVQPSRESKNILATVVKNIRSRQSKESTKKTMTYQSSTHKDLVSLVIEDESIGFKVEPTKATVVVNHNDIFTCVEKIAKTVDDAENILIQDFVEHSIKLVGESVEEHQVEQYLNALNRQRENQVLQAELAAIQVPDAPSSKLIQYPKLQQALHFAQVVRQVLQDLILHQTSTEISTVMDPQKNLITWISQITELCQLRHQVFLLKPSESLDQFKLFESMLISLENLVEKDDFWQTIQELEESNINFIKFIAAIERLAATTMFLCIIELALQQEKQRVHSIQSRAAEEGKAKNPAEWRFYEEANKLLTAYMKENKDAKKLIVVSKIICLLPLVDSFVVEQWQKHGRADLLPISQQSALKFLTLTEVQCDVNVDISAEVTIILTNKNTLSPLFIQPWRLHPAYAHKAAALDENERPEFSPLKIDDAYLRILRITPTSRQTESVSQLISNMLVLKDPGARFERTQLEKMAQNIYSHEDKLMLLGLYALLYIWAVQRGTALKEESNSRIAQAIAVTCLWQWGLDVKIFREIFNHAVRPKALHSSQKLQAVPVAHELSVLLALQRAILAFQNPKIAHVNEKREDFFDVKQLEFGIRGNGYLQLIYLDAIIQKHQLLPKDASCYNQIQAMLSIVYDLMQDFCSLPKKISTYLASLGSTNINNTLKELTVFAQFKLAFIFVIEFFRVILTAFTTHFPQAKEYKNLQALFAYLQAEAGFSFKNEPQGLIFSLAAEFLGLTNALGHEKRVEYNTQTLSSASASSIIREKCADTVFHYNGGLVEVSAPNQEERRVLLSSGGVKTLFALDISDQEKVLVTDLLSYK